MDYQSLKFKCGLEIHQQLDTNKLFCNCSTKLKEEKLDIEIQRKIRAAAGESGEIDIASKFEQEKDKTFTYQCYKDEYCLIEMDEQPPLPINQEALKTALTLAKLLKLEIPPELNVMRKTITDGSACSGFQRTVLIALESPNSYIETPQGKVKITGLYLEEDACKIKNKQKDKTTYSLSRQGIPLIELNTDASIKSPEQARQAASIIGMILRSFPEVKKGLGTIRQDVNLSIKDQSRVEIKGFQDLKSMPLIINNEIKRQLDLLKNKKSIKPEVRKAEPDNSTTFLRPIPGAARLYPETDIPTIKITKKLLDSLEIPELLTEKTIKLKKSYNLPSELAQEIVKNNIDFKKFTNIKDKILAANILIEYPKKIKTKHNIDIKLKDDDFLEIITNAEKYNLSKEAIEEILIKKTKHKKINYKNYKTPDNIESVIKDIISKNQGAPFNALMGEAMKILRGSVNGKEIANIIKKNI